MRNLASIQVIKDIQPILGADKIEVLSILGWKVVAQKGLHQVGDGVVYIEIDSMIPASNPHFEFLRQNCYKKLEDGTEWYRLRTIKLRGQISQGLCMSLDILPDKPYIGGDPEPILSEYEEGEDITEVLGIIKYEPTLKITTYGNSSSLPSFIYATDETRLQSIPRILDEFISKECYISTKVNGTSSTYYFNTDEFGVCSHHCKTSELPVQNEGKVNIYWEISRKYDLQNKLSTLLNNKHYAIQGEIAGPGIQKNNLCLIEHKLYVFNIWDIDNAKYLDFADLKECCKELMLDMVPDIEIFTFTPEMASVDYWIKKAEGLYQGTQNYREGVVVRTLAEITSRTRGVAHNRMSFKVINNQHLLEEKE